jgi:hypothetical protein
MEHKGSLYLVWLNKGQSSEPEFAASFIPHAAASHVANSRKFQGEEALQEYLIRSLRLKEVQLETVFFDLHNRGNAEIDSINISEDDFRDRR